MRTRNRIISVAALGSALGLTPDCRADARIRLRGHDPAAGRCRGSPAAPSISRAVQADVPRPPGLIPRSARRVRRRRADSVGAGAVAPAAAIPKTPRCRGRARPSRCSRRPIVRHSTGRCRRRPPSRRRPRRSRRSRRCAPAPARSRAERSKRPWCRSNTPPSRAWSRRSGSSAACMRKATASSSPICARSSISAASPTAMPTTIRSAPRRATWRTRSCRSATITAKASRIPTCAPISPARGTCMPMRPPISAIRTRSIIWRG